nr:putative late blight resistance protein homolog R1B-23 [Nicotiana tomentosiformis]
MSQHLVANSILDHRARNPLEASKASFESVWHAKQGKTAGQKYLISKVCSFGHILSWRARIWTIFGGDFHHMDWVSSCSKVGKCGMAFSEHRLACWVLDLASSNTLLVDRPLMFGFLLCVKGELQNYFLMFGELAEMLRKRLIGKRYLIVLDDMWDIKAWEDLRLSFSNVETGRRIIVTIRLEEVDKQVKHDTNPYSLPFLTRDESLKLLQKRVFQKEACPPELQDVSLAVAKRCKGLPLVIILVAGIIKRKKMEESWWHEVRNALLSYLGEAEGYSFSTMQLSYDNLPDSLKPCLLYMGMFPEDARIPVSKLISLWIAEGFVQNIESERLMEEATEGYLMDLINSNVVMVERRRYNGKVKYCQVHDVVLHFCLEKSREEIFMFAVKGNYSDFQPSDWKETRLSIKLTKELSKIELLTAEPFHQHLRSLITNDGGEYSVWNPFPHISKLGFLKVLDLSSQEVVPLSSATLHPLICLKYLAVRTDQFDFHPESHLRHLETLIVLASKRVVLPPIFWKMEKLRHVYIGGVVFDLENNKQGIFEESSKLENLRILRHVRYPINDGECMDVLLRLLTNKFEHLQLQDWGTKSEEWCLKDIKFNKLKLLKLVLLGISRLDGPEESFPKLETLVIRMCHNLEEIPPSFADIETLKQIKLIGRRPQTLEPSAVKLKEVIEEIEGCSRLNLIMDVWISKHHNRQLRLQAQARLLNMVLFQFFLVPSFFLIKLDACFL